jgi:hypothetical protein
MTDLEQRLVKLERRAAWHPWLCAYALLSLPVFVLGWQKQSASALRVTSLEVVDSRGVPMIQLGTGRRSEGGAITLRDATGEKRAWWQVTPTQSTFTLSQDDESAATTAGFSVASAQAKFHLLGKDGSSVNVAAGQAQPELEIRSKAGASLFRAPWK